MPLGESLFRIGAVPREDFLQEMLGDELFGTLGLNRDDYRLQVERPDKNASFTRAALTNRQTGYKSVVDLKWGAMTAGEFRSIHLVYHDNAEAVVPAQLERSTRYSPQNRLYDIVNPLTMLARGMKESVLTGKTITQIFSEGSEQAKIAPHRYDESDDGFNVGGMVGINPYSSESLQRYISSMVNVMLPSNMSFHDRQQELNYISTSIDRGTLSYPLKDYALKRHGSIPRVVLGPYDVRQRELERDASGKIIRTETSFYKSLKGPKEVKHGQAGIGSKRETAVPIDSSGNVLQPGKLNLQWRKTNRGMLETDNWNEYISSNTLYEYQQKSLSTVAGDYSEAHMNKMMVGLTLIPAAIPAGSGASYLDTRNYRNIRGFAIQQTKSLPLEHLITYDALQDADLGDLTSIVGRTINAGRGMASIHQYKLGEQKFEIELERAARKAKATGVSLAIPPHYFPQAEKMTFSSTSVYDEMNPRVTLTSPTTKLAQEIQRKYGISVTTDAMEVPELRVGILAEASGAGKDMGVKFGINPIAEDLSVNIGRTPVRVHQMTAEVKSAPMAFAHTFGAYSVRDQAALARRVPGIGRKLGDWIQRTYEGSERTDMAAIVGKYRELRGDGNTLTFSEEILNSFITSKRPMEDLKRFGIAHIAKPQWIKGDVVSESEMNERKHAQMTALRELETNAGASDSDIETQWNQYFGFEPDKRRSGMYRSKFWMNEGMIMPLATNITPELSGWGTMNYRQIQSMYSQFPETARLLGMLPTDSSITDSTSRSKRSWANVVKWSAYDQSMRQGEYYLPGKEERLNVNEEAARTIYSKIHGETQSDREAFEGLSDLDKLNRIEQAYKDYFNPEVRSGVGRWRPGAMTFHPNTRAFLPSPDTIRGLISDDELGDDRTGIAKSYIAAHERALFNEANIGASPEETAGVVGNFRTMMGNTLSKRGIHKALVGYDAPGMVFERYSGMGWLESEEIYLPEREFDRMLGSLPVSSKERKEILRRMNAGHTPADIYNAAILKGDQKAMEAYVSNKYFGGKSNDRVSSMAQSMISAQQSLAREYLPGYSYRQPDEGPWHVMPYKVVGPWQLAARGINPENIDPWVSAGVSSFFSVVGFGDEDQDPLQGFLSMRRNEKGRVEFVETDEMRRFWAGANQVLNRFSGAMGTTPQHAGALISTIFGSDQSSRHILRKTVGDYLLATAMGDTPAFKKGMGGQQVSKSEYSDAMKDVGQSKWNMGTVYNAMRLMESSNAALGALHDPEFQRNIFTPMGEFYQAAIDLELGETNALFNSLRMARFGEEGELGTSLFGETNGKLSWNRMSDPRQSPGTMFGFAGIVRGLGATKEVRDETLSYLLAPRTEGTEAKVFAERNITALKRLRELQAEDPGKWGRITRGDVLLGDVKLPGLQEQPRVGQNSIFYNALESAAVWNTLEKPDPSGKHTQTRENRNSIMVNSRFGQMSLGQLAQQPEIFMTNMLQRFQTGKPADFDMGEMVGMFESFAKVHGPMTQEKLGQQTALFQAFSGYARTVMGDSMYMRSLAGKGTEEQQMHMAARERQADYFTQMMKLKEGKPINIWTGTLAAHLAGKKGYNTTEKMIAQHLGLQDYTVRDLGSGQEVRPLDVVYPFDPSLAKEGREFEKGWMSKARIPGSARRAGTSEDPTLSADDLMVSDQMGNASLNFVEAGLEMSIRPDYVAWEPSSGQFNLAELKLGASSAEVAANQVSIYARGLNQLAQTSGGRRRITERLESAFPELARNNPTEIERMVDSMRSGKIGAWTVAGLKSKGGVMGYSDPTNVDWRGRWDDMSRRIPEEILPLFRGDKFNENAHKVVRDFENRGFSMYHVRRFLGQNKDEAAAPELNAPALRTSEENLNNRKKYTVEGQGEGQQAPMQQRPMFNGPRKDDDLLRADAIAAVDIANTFPGVSNIIDFIEQQAAGALGMSFGDAGTNAAALLAQLGPEQFGQLMSPIRGDVRKYSKMFTKVKAGLRGGALQKLEEGGFDKGALTYAKGFAFGGEEGAPGVSDYQGLMSVYSLNQIMDSLGVPTGKPKGPNVGDFIGGMNADWVAANRAHLESQLSVLNQGKGTSIANRLFAREKEQLHGLELARVEAGNNLVSAQLGVEQAFKGVAGFSVPQDLIELEQFMKPGQYDEKQESALRTLKKAYDQDKHAAGKLKSFESEREQRPFDLKNLKSTVDGFLKIDDAMQKLNKTMEDSAKNIGKVKEGQHELSLAQKEESVRRAAENLADKLGVDYTDPRKLRERARNELEWIASTGSNRGMSGRASAEEIGESLLGLSNAENAFTMEDEEIKEMRRGRGIGSAARNVLSGFGLMYLRSIGNLITSGTRYGYDESLQARAASNQSLAGVFGGIAPDFNPDRRLSAIQSLYGGGGWRGIRTAQANLAQNNPGLMNVANSAISGVSAFGLTSWAIPEVATGLGMSAGAAASLALPFAVGAGLLVSGGVMAANAYGAYKDIDSTATTIGSRMIDSGVGRNPRFGNMMGRNVFEGVWGAFDAASWGYATNPEIRERAKIIAGLSEETKLATQNNQTFDSRKYLESQGITDPVEQQRIIANYSVARGVLGEERGIPGEGMYSAIAFETLYNATLTDKSRDQLALAYAGGIDLPGISGQILSTTTGLAGGALHAMIPGMTTSLIGSSSLQLENYALGAQRIASLGPTAALSPDRYTPDQILEKTEEYANIKPKQWDIYSRRYNIALAQRAMGMEAPFPIAPTDAPDLTVDQYTRSAMDVSMDERVTSSQQQIYGGYQALGISAGQIGQLMGQLPKTPIELETVANKGRIAESIVSNAATHGLIGSGDKGKVLLDYYKGINQGQYSTMDLSILAGAAQFDSHDYAVAFSRNMTIGGNELPFTMLQEEIGQFGSMAGKPTGMPLFSTTMNWGDPASGRGLWGSEVATLLWGKNWASAGPQLPSNWRTGQQTGMVAGMVNGIKMPFNDPFTGKPAMIGGTMAAQYMLGNLQYEQAMASAGNQMAQLNLSAAFTTGVGLSAYSGITNPQTGQPFGFNTGKFKWSVNGDSFKSTGGGLWGLEDASRALSYSQQEFNFEMQSKQLEMNSRQFYENSNLNRRQSTMQRDWAKEDWAYQDNMRSMQWGWQVSDFQEEARFMTGRDRRKAERGMERETIVHNAEGEQIDKQRERQQQLWKLEDERFDIQRRQHEEQKAHQQEQLKVTREYYEERKKLEAEQIKLQRAMWTEQMNLQRQAIGIQAHYAKKQQEAQEIMIAVSLLQSGIAINQKEASLANDSFWQKVREWIRQIRAMLGNQGDGTGGDGSTTSIDGEGAYGMDMVVPPNYPNDSFRIGVSSGERVVVMPAYQAQNPWNNVAMYNKIPGQDGGGGGGGGVIVLNLHIGNERLGQFVIDAVSRDLEA